MILNKFQDKEMKRAERHKGKSNEKVILEKVKEVLKESSSLEEKVKSLTSLIEIAERENEE